MIQDSIRIILKNLSSGSVVTALGEKADVNAYQLYSYDEAAKENKLFAAIPGVAEFKVWPNQYSQTDAEYFFSDSYKTRAVDIPVWSVQGTPELNNGILSVKMIAKGKHCRRTNVYVFFGCYHV